MILLLQSSTLYFLDLSLFCLLVLASHPILADLYRCLNYAVYRTRDTMRELLGLKKIRCD